MINIIFTRFKNINIYTLLHLQDIDYINKILERLKTNKFNQNECVRIDFQSK